MTFAHPHLLWLLALPAALLLATAFARARVSANPHPKIPQATFNPGHSSFVIRHSSFSRRPVAALAALALLILALARPQGASISTPSFVQARDVLVAVDVSRSMLADDVPPTRLARARLLVRDLADDLRGERLGLLPFAGTAFLQSPLSADYEIFRTFLDELGPEMIPAGGSDFAALLRVAADAFGPATPPDAAAPLPDRYLIILSDGEAENDSWRPLAHHLSERGVRVIALGLGTATGAMVPDASGGLAKDARGAAVLSRLNPATLQELARVTGGAYRDASSWIDLPALLKETVARGRAARADTEHIARRRELFPWFLAPALLLLALSLVREFPPAPRASIIPPRAAATTAARLLLLALGLHCAIGYNPTLFAAEPDAAPDPLLSLVEKLSVSAKLSAPDLARLATLSAERGEQARAQTQGSTSAPTPFPEGAVRDAIAAVNAGQTTDPRAADWPALRKRLEALLAPPPQQQPQQQQQNSKQQDPSKKDQKDQPQSSDQSSSGQSPDKSQSEQSQSKPKSDDSQSGSSGASSGSPDNPSSQNSSADSPPKPSGEKPLGDLSSAPKPEPDAKSDSPDKSSASSPAPDSPSADEPTQQAGGVSASGRPADSDSAADTAAIDPALVVPQQRLERVRGADSPARLFQLLQKSETTPEERERRAAGSKQTW